MDYTFNNYNPYDWVWLVQETNKYWSSKYNSYVTEFDEDKLTTIGSEKDLSQVLSVYGLRGPVILVPSQVTMYQARAALIQAGLFQQVDTDIQSLGSSSLEYQAWEYATNFYRNSPFIVSLGTQLGLTSDQIDQLFIAANNIT